MPEASKGLLIQLLPAGCHRMLPHMQRIGTLYTAQLKAFWKQRLSKTVVKHINRSIKHQDNPRTNYHQTISLPKVRPDTPKAQVSRKRNKTHFLLKGNTEKEKHNGLCCLRKSSTAQLFVAKIFRLSSCLGWLMTWTVSMVTVDHLLQDGITWTWR